MAMDTRTAKKATNAAVRTNDMQGCKKNRTEQNGEMGKGKAESLIEMPKKQNYLGDRITRSKHWEVE
jgi:hypothetical protein